MQVPNAILVVAAEINIVLIISTVFFFVHARKLKSLVRRQQEKLLELLQVKKSTPEPPPPSVVTDYKTYLNRELDATSTQFSTESPGADIALELPDDSPVFQRILALRYAFLRAEELGTTEEIGTQAYWNIFQQTLTPLLSSSQSPLNVDNSDSEEELNTAKKRIENLEKFKRLFFDMEKQWKDAQANAQDYYGQLLELSEGVHDREAFNDVLQNYHGVYDSISQNITQVVQNTDSFDNKKIINITRQDPRAAEEIVKLRNVAADQHRIINNLQKKLEEATTAEEKEIVIVELQQQLQRQVRFVQESETCIQLLEDELAKAHEEIVLKDKTLDETSLLSEENQQIKSTLHNFTLESRDLLNSINELEEENDSLKQNMNQTAPIATHAVTKETVSDSNKIHTELSELKKQYAELEERYLDLKLSQL
ncbi:MAG: hypothetical protein EOO52_00080 [Gammaproteobacteria bacterium]|nr:MAG: hypothetical protein EOO52_00080 [Gammaproteobacteria bacterium]